MSWMRSSCSAACRLSARRMSAGRRQLKRHQHLLHGRDRRRRGGRRCGRPRLRGAGGRREQVRHEASRGLLEQSGGDVVVDGGDVARLGGAVPAEWHSELVDHLLVAPVRVRVRHPVPDAVDREQVRVRPPHGDLKHLVQLAQRRLTGDQHPPPHRRPDLPQLHLDLEDPRLAVTANGKHPPDAVTDAVPHPSLGSGRSVLARARPDEEYHRSGPCLVRRRLGAARAAIRRLPRPSGKDCPMRALLFTAYGGPEVLEWADAPAPHPGPGQIRITVRAASVNPIDWKTFTGAMAGGQPKVGIGYLGYDAAGVVDEVGEGVTGVSVGDDVLGRGQHTQAEYAVLDSWAAKPPAVDWAVATAAGGLAAQESSTAYSAWVCWPRPSTSSPTDTPVTPSPTSSTTPAAS